MLRSTGWLLASTLLLAGCGAGGASKVAVDPSRPPPAPETPPPPPEADDKPAAADSAVPESPAAPPVAPGYPAAVLIGARVAGVRTEPAEIVVEVGDSLAWWARMWRLVAYDAAKARPVPGVRILPNIESRFAALQEGHIMGRWGRARPNCAWRFRCPPPSGTGPPEKSGPSPRRSTVVGPPVACRLRSSTRACAFYPGALVQLEARALSGGRKRAPGSPSRSTWTSDRRRLATVDERGFVTDAASGGGDHHRRRGRHRGDVHLRGRGQPGSRGRGGRAVAGTHG